MEEERRTFPHEFTLDTVNRVTGGLDMPATVTEALSAHANIMFGLVWTFEANSDGAFQGNGKLTAHDEMDCLQRENADLREWRDEFKTSPIWSAKHFQ